MKDITCVECGSTNVIKKGTNLYRYGRVQLYKCNDCARVFNGELLERREINYEEQRRVYKTLSR